MKIIININNYEAYWVDYLDGNLSAASEAELFGFLENHTDIAASLIDADDYILPNLEFTYPDKISLKAENQIENLIIAKIENQISDEDNSFIIQKINSDKGIAATFNLYKKTIIIADKTVVYKGKKHFKKALVIPWYGYAYAIAAVFAIFFVTTWFIRANTLEVSPGNKPQYSQISLPERENSSQLDNTEEIKKHNITITNSQKFDNYPSLSQASEIITVAQKISVPDRMPMASFVLEDENITNKQMLMEYTENKSEDIAGFEYSMQFVRTQKKTK